MIPYRCSRRVGAALWIDGGQRRRKAQRMMIHPRSRVYLLILFVHTESDGPKCPIGFRSGGNHVYETSGCIIRGPTCRLTLYG